MKRKLLLSVVMLAVAATAMAQSVTVRFTARSSSGSYHGFDSVRVENLSQGWSQRLAYPDTTLTLGSSSGIATVGGADAVSLKVYPNPFAGATESLMQLAEDGEVSIRLLRVNGSVVSEYSGFLQAGAYRLGVSLAEPQVAFLSVATRSGRSVVKMVNNAAGESDRIVVTPTNAPASRQPAKAVAVGPFSVGDQMRYTAVSLSGGVSSLSTPVTQSQTAGGQVTLVFVESDVPTAPVVSTSEVSNITASTATCGGSVSYDGGQSVTARGVCYGTSHNPTTSGSHTTDGTGTGSFTSNLGGLSASTTYYVRAYATNSVGTAYGQEMTFTTGNVTPTTGGFDQNGASYATFSTSPHTTVKFSKGNLQYTTTGTHAVATGGTEDGTWRFAEHQYDYIPWYSDYLNFFAWGTSGWNSGATYYHPCCYDSTSTEYWPGGHCYNNLTDHYANADWGVYNAISNGGNQPGMWRTMTVDEWVYLYARRQCSTVNGVANARFAKATVGEVTGLLIFPDNYVHPASVAQPVNINVGDAAFGGNAYTLDDFALMEQAGIIFFPATGYMYYNGEDRYASGVAYYYLSSYHSYFHARITYISDGAVTDGYANRGLRLPVRLVQGSVAVYDLPNVTTTSVTEIGNISAVCSGTVASHGGAYWTPRGVCWSTHHNPTLDDNFASGTGYPDFTATMTGLQPGTTYYVRAYVTNVTGTSYGDELTFTTTNEPMPGEWVDLGLPSGLLWYSVNLGATAPEDYGDYYAWGETRIKADFREDNYAHYAYDNGWKLTKYCTNIENSIYDYYMDGLTTLEASDDAATAVLGDGARMPTREEWIELINNNNTASEWTTVNGVEGLRISSWHNSNSIFLPAAGYRYGSAQMYPGRLSQYWTSSLDFYDGIYYDGFGFSDYYTNYYLPYFRYDSADRTFGLPVRAVRSQN